MFMSDEDFIKYIAQIPARSYIYFGILSIVTGLFSCWYEFPDTAATMVWDVPRDVMQFRALLSATHLIGTIMIFLDSRRK